jgi:hypothetical protein
MYIQYFVLTSFTLYTNLITCSSLNTKVGIFIGKRIFIIECTEPDLAPCLALRATVGTVV